MKGPELPETPEITRAHQRRYPIGAEPVRDGHAHVRVWAPDRRRVAVVIDGVDRALEADADGYFAALVPGAPGSRYGFRLDDDVRVYPDPASRFQPDGPQGLSEIIDPSSHRWHDDGWPGISLAGQVLYEMHVGTFTSEGTWAAAAQHLDALAELGVTTIQMMPVADFAGEFGWGYDGVNWFAPTRLYGRPDDLRRFVDAAHARGLGVILDAVYNHLGPDGNYLGSFSRHYFTDRYKNEWGEALNFDGQHSAAVRELVLSSIEHWVREYHCDGFRLDATQQIFDASPEHLVRAIARRARASAGGRSLVIIAENEPQHSDLMRSPEEGGYGLDALYNDDFHHTARVALTGLREAYYSDYRGSARELLAASKRGFLYQGQRYPWQSKRRGTAALDRPPRQFVHFLENHDQVANTVTGRRLSQLAGPGALRALTSLLLLGPETPLLFQGQEYGSTAPFLYFAHHEGDLRVTVREGRRAFLSQFARYRTAEFASRLLDPAARSTFHACTLDHDTSERAQQYRQLHRDLLRLRREDATIALQGEGGLDGATLDDRAFVLRFSGPGRTARTDRLLVVNLGPDFELATMPESLIAPPASMSWTVLWSSEDFAYGGNGTPEFAPDEWPVPGHAALLLAPIARIDARAKDHARG